MVAVHRSDAVIYSVSVGRPSRFFAGGRRGNRGGSGGDENTMRRLAGETGGSHFTIRERDDFERAFKQINDELRNQYSLAYMSTNTSRDGKFRRIHIIPRDSSYRIQARKGYYAPQTDSTP